MKRIVIIIALFFVFANYTEAQKDEDFSDKTQLNYSDERIAVKGAILNYHSRDYVYGFDLKIKNMTDSNFILNDLYITVILQAPQECGSSKLFSRYYGSFSHHWKDLKLSPGEWRELSFDFLEPIADTRKLLVPEVHFIYNKEYNGVF